MMTEAEPLEQEEDLESQDDPVEETVDQEPVDDSSLEEPSAAEPEDTADGEASDSLEQAEAPTEVAEPDDLEESDAAHEPAAEQTEEDQPEADAEIDLPEEELLEEEPEVVAEDDAEDEPQDEPEAEPEDEIDDEPQEPEAELEDEVEDEPQEPEAELEDEIDDEPQEPEAEEAVQEPEAELEDEPETELEDEEDGEPQEPEAEVEDDGRLWYVVHCYSGYENKVRHNLEQRIESMGMKSKIFDVVVPTEEEIEVKEGKRRTVERRVFPGYILVQMLMDEDSWYVVRNTPGVTGFVGMGNDPTPLRPEEVASIVKRMEADAPRIKVTYTTGQKVRIIDGPFNDFIGTVDDIDMERAKVRVMVSFFGRETPVELDFLQVEKA
jgi:transcriptional antiterminator NusG